MPLKTREVQPRKPDATWTTELLYTPKYVLNKWLLLSKISSSRPAEVSVSHQFKIITFENIKLISYHWYMMMIFKRIYRGYLVPTFTAPTPPSRPVPVPKGMMGRWCLWQTLARALTSSADRGNTTTSGGRQLGGTNEWKVKTLLFTMKMNMR